MSFLSKLEEIENRYEELESELSSPEIFQDREKYTELAKAHSDLSEIVTAFREYKKCQKELEDNRELAQDSDEEIRELAQQEIEELEPRIEELETQLRSYLMPKDPLDEKSVIMEIRAGTGGEEASLFVADLLKMYMRYAEQNKWKVELIDSHETGSGGFKEVIASVSGERVYSKLKFESGVHRVQRVPSTESQGRVHTSAVTVAILPEAEEVDVEIDPNELRVDVFRASGPGGQSVNTTESAIRITHLPTGVVVNCQDEKSQHKNKAKAMKVLRSRLLQMKQDQAKQEEDEARRAQVGSGDRSERIRTYNFPQNRITDHRINLTSYNIESVMDGNLDEIIDPLIENQKAEALQGLENS